MHFFGAIDAKYVMFCVGLGKSLKGSTTPANIPEEQSLISTKMSVPCFVIYDHVRNFTLSLIREVMKVHAEYSDRN